MAFAKRYVLTILSFLGFINLYLMRSNLGVALVAMVKTRSEPTSITSAINTTTLSPEQFGEGCHEWTPWSSSANNNTNSAGNGEFEWDRTTQGMILGAFFFGYVFCQVPGGYLSTKYGPVRVLAVGIAGSSLMTLLSPLAAMAHPYVLVAVRVVLGMFEGVFIPSNHVVWSRWAPKEERTRLVALSFSGVHIGIVLAMFGSGLIANFLNWQWIFYICGILGVIWTIVWYIFAYDSPSDPKANVSPEELDKILGIHHSDTPPAGPCRKRRFSASPEAVAFVKVKKEHAKLKTPWLKILLSLPVWAIIFAQFAHTWFFYTLMTQLSIFINDELHLPLVQNGILTALPFAAFFVGQTTSSYLCDWLVSNPRFSTTVIRKSFYGTGALLASFFIVILPFVGCNIAIIVPCICLSALAEGFTICGFFMNHIDIAPQYAGILMGMSNGIGAIPGMLSPMITGRLTTNSATGPPSVVMDEWKYVFFTAAAVHLAGAVIFIIFGSGQLQSWAIVEKPDNVALTPVNEAKNQEGEGTEAAAEGDAEDDRMITKA